MEKKKGMSSNTSYGSDYATARESERNNENEYHAYQGNELFLDETRISKPSRSKGKTSLSFLSWWLPEILTTFISLATFLAVVIVLRTYEGRGTTDLRLPNHFTLNGIIAAIATLNKAFLMAPVASAIAQELWLYYATEAQKTNCSSRLQAMNTFDSASRGVRGSIVFLLRFRGRRLVASLGALITIGSLAFSTCVQQLIAFDQLVPAGPGTLQAPGNVPRSEYWNQWWGNPAEGGDALGPPLEMIAAVYSGVLSGGASPLIASCQSGNCTWPLTPSLAVCGGCVKSSYSALTCYNPFCQNSASSQHNTSNTQCQPENEIGYCNYTLPSGSVATIYDFSLPDSSEGSPGFVSIPSTTGAFYNKTTADRLYVGNFDLFGVPYDSFSVPHPTTDELNVFECALWMCVQTYNTSTVATQQVETIVATEDRNGTVEPIGADTNLTFPQLPSSADPNNVTPFFVDSLAAVALNTFLDNAFNGKVGINEESQTYSTDLMHGIWNGTENIDAWINGVATSMTNVVRTMSPTHRTQYDGTGYLPGVSVRWAWLCLPAVLVVLSMVLLIMVIIRTEQSSVKAWKAKPLTFLLFDVDPELRSNIAGMSDQPGGIERAVGKTTVRLIDTADQARKFKQC